MANILTQAEIDTLLEIGYNEDDFPLFVYHRTKNKDFKISKIEYSEVQHTDKNSSFIRDTDILGYLEISEGDCMKIYHDESEFFEYLKNRYLSYQGYSGTLRKNEFEFFEKLFEDRPELLI